MVSAIDYQHRTENNFLILVRLERVEKGHLTVSSLGIPSVMTVKTMESLFSLAEKDGGGVAVHFLVPTWHSDFSKNKNGHHTTI